MASLWVPKQGTSHTRLLESGRPSADGLGFAAIVVPTNRPVEWLTACMQLARETATPLVVVCSKLVRRRQVIKMATDVGVKAYALDWPSYSANPNGGDISRRSIGWTLSAALSVA